MKVNHCFRDSCKILIRNREIEALDVIPVFLVWALRYFLLLHFSSKHHLLMTRHSLDGWVLNLTKYVISTPSLQRRHMNVISNHWLFDIQNIIPSNKNHQSYAIMAIWEGKPTPQRDSKAESVHDVIMIYEWPNIHLWWWCTTLYWNVKFLSPSMHVIFSVGN